MAKKSVIQRNLKRQRIVKKYETERKRLKALQKKATTVKERFQIALELSKLPRDASPIRIKRRCELTGRAKGYFRDFGMSRILLRKLANQGELPGVVKASW